MARRAIDLVRPEVRELLGAPGLRLAGLREARAARGEAVFDLTRDESPFPVPERMLAALRGAPGSGGPPPPEGLPVLRRAIAGHVERRLGVDRTEQDVLVGPGHEVLDLLLSLAFDGEILVPTPAPAGFSTRARVLGRPVRRLPCRREDGWLLRPVTLREACEGARRPQLLVLGSPSEVSGLSHAADELRELARIAEAHDLIVLSEEHQAELHHKGQHASIARHHPAGTIVSTGLSGWAGVGDWRLGALVFPEALGVLFDATAQLGVATFGATSAPIQHAAAVAFEGGPEIERHLLHARRVLAALARGCARRLTAAGLGCAQPQAGFQCLVDFEPHGARLRERGLATSVALSERLLADTGVALLAGSEVGLVPEELVLRLSIVDLDGASALEAISVIPREQPLDDNFLRRHAPRILEALGRIAEWLAA